MVISFDSLGMFEKPNVQICNPNGEKIKSISKIIFETSVILRYNPNHPSSDMQPYLS